MREWFKATLAGSSPAAASKMDAPRRTKEEERRYMARKPGQTTPAIHADLTRAQLMHKRVIENTERPRARNRRMTDLLAELIRLYAEEAYDVALPKQRRSA